MVLWTICFGTFIIYALISENSVFNLMCFLLLFSTILGQLFYTLLVKYQISY